MKNYTLLLIISFLVSCVPVSKAPAAAITQTLNASPATKQNTSSINNVATNANLELIGRVLVYTPNAIYIANSDGSVPVLIHTIESPFFMMSLSPDGTRFAYFQDNYLYIQNVKTGDAKPLNQEILGSMGGALRWSRDGKKITLSCSTANEPASSGSICLINADSGQIEILIREKNLGEVHPLYSNYFIGLDDWSRDGSKIIFTYYTPSEKGQKQDFEIYLYDMSSKITRMVLDGKKQDVITQFGSAAISPDNKTLLISGGDIDSSLQLFQVDLESNILSQLTKSATYSFSNPVWGSDNSYFYAYASQNTSSLNENTVILNANGDLLSFLNIRGTVIGWIK